MSRTWADLLGDAEDTERDEAERSGFFSRLRDSLSKSRRALTDQLVLAAFDPGDDEAWERLEEALIRADVGVPRDRRARAAPRGARRDPRPRRALAEEIESLFGEPPRSSVGEQARA